MQIIEVSSFGVRSAVIRLRHRRSPLQFVIYPMIHMAEAGFYTEVTRRLKAANFLVVEGVRKGSSGKANLLLGALTLSYRILRFNRRVRLVEQDIDYSQFEAPILNPDVTADEFETSWQTVPLRHRLLMYCVLPVVIVGQLLGGSRVIWTKATEVYDLPMVEEEEPPEDTPDWDEIFGGERDTRLLDTLSRLHREHSGEGLEVAIVYGAGHVPAIVQGLMDRHNYRPRSADWLTIAHL